jgi:hypothetical protein
MDTNHKYIIINNNKYISDLCNNIYNNVVNKGITITIENNITENNYDENTIYIILTFFGIQNLPKKFILYNFEQLVTERVIKNNFLYNCSKAIAIWDYAIENIEFWKKHNINAKFVPYIWFDNYNKLDNNLNEYEIDILFYGSINERRQKILNEIKKRLPHLKILVINKVFGNELEELIIKSKIIINIHYYDRNQIFEVSRIIPLILNNKIVISETSNCFYSKLLKDIIIWFNYDDIDSLINKIIDVKNIITEDKKERIKKLNLTNYILER